MLNHLRLLLAVAGAVVFVGTVVADTKNGANKDPQGEISSELNDGHEDIEEGDEEAE